jgi:hypothetical protein
MNQSSIVIFKRRREHVALVPKPAKKREHALEVESRFWNTWSMSRGQRGRRVRNARLRVYIGRTMHAVGGGTTPRTMSRVERRASRLMVDLRLHRRNADMLWIRNILHFKGKTRLQRRFRDRTDYNQRTVRICRTPWNIAGGQPINYLSLVLRNQPHQPGPWADRSASSRLENRFAEMILTLPACGHTRPPASSCPLSAA